MSPRSATLATPPAPTSEGEPPGRVALDTALGLKILRRLARSPRRELLLAHDPDDRWGGRVVVIAVYAATIARELVDAELVALEHAQGPHVVRLHDVGSLPDRTVGAALERLTGGSLAELQSRRSELSAGEAATILAPLASTVQRLHRSGVALGAISSDSVLFTDAGSPTLIDFSVAVTFEPGLPEVKLERIAEVVADREALTAIARAVLALVRGAGSRESLALRERLDQVPSHELSDSIVDGLFAFTAGSPVDLDADLSRAFADGGDRGVLSLDGSPQSRTAAVDGADRRFRLLEGAGAGVRKVIGHARTALRRGDGAVDGRRPRRSAVVAVLTAALTLGICLIVIPAPRSPELSSATRTDAGASDATPSPDPSGAGAAESAAPSASGSRSAEADAVAGDDPAAAALVLLSTRERCIRDLSVVCLADVDQEGSPALDDDREIIRALQEDGVQPELPALGGLTITGVQLIGDSAVLTLAGETAPASLLLMRGEAGWRLRGYTASGS